MSFTDKIIKSRNYLIRIVLGKNAGKQAWWILKINPSKFEIYKVKLASGNIGSLDEYGEVLSKGWGEDASEDIMQNIMKQYS